MSKKMPQPQFLIDYYDTLRKGPPRCCHTCEHYSDNGQCDKFQTEPPIDFIQTQDQCQSWEQNIPF